MADESKLADKKEFDDAVKGVDDFPGLKKDLVKLYKDSGMGSIYQRTLPKDRRFAVGGNKEAKLIKFMAVAIPEGPEVVKFRSF